MKQLVDAVCAKKGLSSAPKGAGKGSACRLLSHHRSEQPPANVLVFNPFAEAYIPQGDAFTPVKQQCMLAEDLANLPQFLCEPHDIVLLPKKPSDEFLDTLRAAGFPLPEFVELKNGRIDPAGGLCERPLRTLRPWAWSPDSVSLLEPLFACLPGAHPNATRLFNDRIAQLYSKAWSARLLTQVLARCRRFNEISGDQPETQRRFGAAPAKPWLCSEQDVGVVVETLERALEAIAVIRGRGHHRIVVKQTHGLAGNNAIRLWEPEILPAQRQWLSHAFRSGRQLVVEPWLERELDFSIQLEMAQNRLNLCGYTGLMNDPKGQFQANWAEPHFTQSLPEKVVRLLGASTYISTQFERLFGHIFRMLETELNRVGFIGPVSIDAFIYRTPQGDCRLKPVVEINPRFTMGRLTLELMKRTFSGSYGLFRLVNRGQVRAAGFTDFAAYARWLGQRMPIRLEGEPIRRIRHGALCLNDPARAKMYLATFQVSDTLNGPDQKQAEEQIIKSFLLNQRST